jgi:hypothetical protein
LLSLCAGPAVSSPRTLHRLSLCLGPGVVCRPRPPALLLDLVSVCLPGNDAGRPSPAPLHNRRCPAPLLRPRRAGPPRAGSPPPRTTPLRGCAPRRAPLVMCGAPRPSRRGPGRSTGGAGGAARRGEGHGRRALGAGGRRRAWRASRSSATIARSPPPPGEPRGERREEPRRRASNLDELRTAAHRRATTAAPCRRRTATAAPPLSRAPDVVVPAPPHPRSIPVAAGLHPGGSRRTSERSDQWWIWPAALRRRRAGGEFGLNDGV